MAETGVTNVQNSGKVVVTKGVRLSIPKDGVKQAAITDFIINDESVTQAIIDNVSNMLTKLLGNKSFIDTLSQKLMENGVLYCRTEGNHHEEEEVVVSAI